MTIPARSVEGWAAQGRTRVRLEGSEDPSSVRLRSSEPADLLLLPRLFSSSLPAMEAIMQRRHKEAAEAVERLWDEGKGSFHPDFDPHAAGLEDFVKASRETEELYLAIVKNDVAQVGGWSRRSRDTRGRLACMHSQECKL
jgi:hypothetical protein